MGAGLVTGIGRLSTPEGRTVRHLDDAAIAVEDGSIAWVGAAADAPDGQTVLDADGGTIVPGFVDAHTHLLFAGDRSDEFAARAAGAEYGQILAAGGGIHATVAATTAAADAQLRREAESRLRRMVALGTTTVEIKSGYGLTPEEELRQLRLIGELDTPAWKEATALAHVPGPGTTPAEAAEQFVNEVITGAASLASGCDVFCDAGAFDVPSARRILEAARAAGMRLHVHAEQLGPSGGAALAASLGAASADHLDYADDDDIRRLADAGVGAVLLPGASLGHRRQAPGRALWDSGVSVAVATDCNPGTSYIESMPLVIALAVAELGLTPDEALWAATQGGASALGLEDRGAVAPGRRADLVVLDAPNATHLAYRPGTDLVRSVVIGGAVID